MKEGYWPIWLRCNAHPWYIDCGQVGDIWGDSQKRKQPEGPSTDEWTHEMHTIECSWAIKRNEVLIHATTWMKQMLHKSSTLPSV